MSPLLFLLLACTSGLPFAEPDDHDEHDEEGEHEDVVELSPTAVQSARIVVTEASEAILNDRIELPARIILDPRKEAIVGAWVAGQVDAIDVRPGDDVKRGQSLGKVQTPELGVATAAYRTALARDSAADARLERLKSLEADGVSSRAQVLEADADHIETAGALEAAEERLRVLGIPLRDDAPHSGHFPSRVPLRSPISGTVLSMDATVGQSVEPGSTLFHVADLDVVWLMLDVYERDLAALAKSQTVNFSVEAYPGEVFHGEVAQVGDWIEPEARTVEVRVEVDNADHRLKPNMYARAELSVGEGITPKGIVLPRDAVQTVEGRPSVFVETTPNRFVARTVVVAEKNAVSVRLSNGVAAGERVVTEGAFALKSDLEKGAMGHGHAH